MREVIQISTLGFSRNDRMVLTSMMKLAQELRDHYRLGSPDDPEVDLIFVNADEPSVISVLRGFQQTNHSLKPIMVTSRKLEIDGEITIKRPLVFRRVVDALKNAALMDRHQHASAGSAATIVSRKKILVVDDSLLVRKYMEHKIPLLTQVPVDLSFAASGEEAMTKVEKESPDLVFLDVMMPGLDGYKVCKWIKLVRPATHIAMLTSKKSPFDKVRGAMSGCDDYLAKPPLKSKLAKILGKKLSGG